MILGNNPAVLDKMVSDLEVLGFSPESGDYPDIDTSDIIRNAPDIIILDLTSCGIEALSTGETFLQGDSIPPGTALVGMVSKDSIRQIPFAYNFDEIITCPYDFTELSYRLRRTAYLHDRESTEDTQRIGNLTISPSKYEVKLDGQPVPFSHKEYELFKFLFTHPSHVFTREELFVTIWGNGRLGESRTVDVHIRRIRAKIGDNDQTYIKTVRGVGYTLRFDNN